MKNLLSICVPAVTLSVAGQPVLNSFPPVSNKGKFCAILCLILSTIFISGVFGQTNVTGNITSNTTWTKASGPYTLTGNVGIPANVTLTIEAGTLVQRSADYQILINGSIIISGTSADSVTFSSSSAINIAHKFFIEFQKSKLDSSFIRSVVFKNQSGKANNIRLGNESEFSQTSPKNSGSLKITGSNLSYGYTATKGYETAGNLTIDSSILLSANVVGYYPRSEKINITNSSIYSSILESQSYNKGFAIVNCYINNTYIKMGCCDANYSFTNSKVENSWLVDADGNPVNGPVSITNCLFLNTSINNPSAKFIITKSKFIVSKKIYNSSNQDLLYLMTVGNISFTNSELLNYSDQAYSGMNISGNDGYSISGTNSVTNNLFSGFTDALYISNFSSINISQNNFIDISRYHINNRSLKDVLTQNNYHELKTGQTIGSIFFDSNDDLTFGTISYTPTESSILATPPLQKPSNVIRQRLSTSGAFVSWSKTKQTRVKKYKVYWGQGSNGFFYQNSVTVDGSDSSVIIPASATSDSIAVTAIDESATGNNDQVAGSESWFSTGTYNATVVTAPAPVINSFTPNSGGAGSKIVIKGANFSGATAVKFGGVSASSFLVDSATGISAIVNSGAISGAVSVTTPTGTSTLNGFIFYPPPGITSFQPTSATSGETITITGTNLTSTTKVLFGGIQASSFTVLSSTQLLAVVASGSSGSISLTTTAGSADKSGFTFVLPAAPKITSFAPTVAAAGATITITGTGFNTNAANNFVSFGGVRTNTISATATQLIVKVPTGAMYEPISVLNTATGLRAYSSRSFLTSFQLGQTPLAPTSFSAKVDIVTGTLPSAAPMCTGDFNNDGKPDVVIAASPSVLAFKNESSGDLISFATKRSFLSVMNQKGMAPADIDGDGKLDLVVTSDTYISVLRNTSTTDTISFASPVDYSTSAFSASAIALAVRDMDEDGKPDIVFYSAQNIYVVRNTSTIGSVSFGSRTQYLTGFSANAPKIAIADIDNDQHPDIAVSGENSVTIAIFRNTSSPGSVSFATAEQLNVVTGNKTLAFGNIDNSDEEDLVFAKTTGIWIKKNNSTAGSIAFGTIKDYFSYNLSIIEDLIMNDFDGDGKVEFAVSFADWSAGHDLISVYRNTFVSGDPSFALKANYLTGDDPRSIASCDINGDGRPDLISVNTTGASFSVLKNINDIPKLSTVSIRSNNTNSGKAKTGDVVTISFTSSQAINTPSVTVAGQTASITNTSGNNWSASYTMQSGDIQDTVAFSISFSSLINVAGVTVTGTTNGSVVVFDKTSPAAISVQRLQPAASLTQAVSVTYAVTFSEVVSGLTISAFQLTTTGTASAAIASVTSASGKTVNVIVNNITGNGSLWLTVVGGAGVIDSAGNTFSGPYTAGELYSIYQSVQPLAVTSFTPLSAVTGSTLTITGTNLLEITAVTLGGTSVASFNALSSTTLTVVVGDGSTGSLVVSTTHGNASLAGFTYIPGLPTITSFIPTAATAGTTITVTGTNFTGPTFVTLGGTNVASFRGLSSTTLTAVVGSGSSGDLKVTAAGGIAALSGFTFLPAAPPAPIITSFEPKYVVPGIPVTITGSNFLGTTSVLLGGTAVASFNVLSSTTISTVMPNVTVDSIYVTTGSGKAISTGFLRISEPTITSINPTSAGAGATVTVTGTNFWDNTVVKTVSFGGVPAASFKVLSYSTLTAVVATGASGSLSVSTIAGSASLAGFNYTGTTPAPTITSFTPTSAAAGATLTVTGTNLFGIISATLGGTSVASFKSLSSTTATLVVGSGSSGTLNITTAGGTAALTGFTYTSPIITSFEPIGAAKGETITVTGKGFTGTLSVTLGGLSVASFKVINDERLTLIVGDGYSGAVRVTTLAGSGSLSGFIFGLPVVPNIYTIEPKSAGAGDTIIITGTNLAGTSSITLGGTAVASFNVLSSTRIKAVVGNGTTGNVSITAAGGSNSLIDGFIYLSPQEQAPSITSFTPTAAAAGATLTVTGTNLSGIISATLGGTAVASIKTLSSTAVVLVVGNGTSGSLSITTSRGTAVKPGFVFIPPVTISSDTNFCKGSSVVMSASASSGNQWYRNNILIPGATATTYTATTTGLYKVIMTYDSIAYPSVNQINLKENAQPVSAFTITGDSAQCLTGNLFTFKNTSTIPGGDLISSRKWIFGDSLFSDLQDVTHVYKNAGSYQVKLVSISNRGCRDTTFRNVLVKNAPAVVITNPAAVCNVNNNATIDITAGSIVNGSGAGLTYTYWKDSTATISLANAAAVSASGTYYIKATDTAACYITKAVAVKINPLPALGIIAGDTTICLKTSAVLSNTTKGGTWSSSNPAVATIDSSGKVSTVTAGVSLITYSYTATATGCSNSVKVTFTVLPLPIAGKPLLSGYNSDTLTCFFNNITISSKNVYDKYLWSNGATGSSVTLSANTPVSLKVGNNQNACYSDSSVIVTVRKNLTVEPVISRVTDNLVSSSASAYKWLFNNKLTGDSTQSIPVGARGIYNVSTSIDRVCWNTSKDYLVIFDPATIKKSFDLIIYPNPTNGIFSLQLKFQSSTTALIKITVSDQAGVAKWNTQKIILLNNTIKIPVSLSIAKGTYVVKVDVNGEINTQQLVVL
jgi:hypothetical protein